MPVPPPSSVSRAERLAAEGRHSEAVSLLDRMVDRGDPHALFTLAMWPWPTALGATAMLAITGLVLTEIALSNWTKVPFASAHEPATDTLKSRAAWYTTTLLMYQFILSEVHFRALQSWRTTLIYLAVCGALIIVIRPWRAHTLRRRTPTFDVVPSDTTTLDLSEALS